MGWRYLFREHGTVQKECDAYLESYLLEPRGTVIKSTMVNDWYFAAVSYGDEVDAVIYLTDVSGGSVGIKAIGGFRYGTKYENINPDMARFPRCLIKYLAPADRETLYKWVRNRCPCAEKHNFMY